MAADLPVIVGEPVGKRSRFRLQQQPHVLVGVAREQHDVGGLEIFEAVLDVDHAGDAAAPARRYAMLVAIACVTTCRRFVAIAFGMVLTAVEFLALTWQPPRLQKP